MYSFSYLDFIFFTCDLDDLLAVACELLVEMCKIQFPDQGLNPGPLYWKHGVLDTGPPGKSLTNCHFGQVIFSLYVAESSTLFFACGVFFLASPHTACRIFSGEGLNSGPQL